MDIYKRRSNLKLVLLVIAVAIGLLTTLYTNYLTHKIATEEKRKANLWAEAITSKAHLVRSVSYTHLTLPTKRIV